LLNSISSCFRVISL